MSGSVCYAANAMKECHYDGLCDGVICIAPHHCRKKWKKLSDEEQTDIFLFNLEILSWLQGE